MAKRLLEKKSLFLLHLEEKALKSVHIADLRSKYSYDSQGFDLVELAAIYIGLPVEFENDGQKLKKDWKIGLETKVKQLFDNFILNKLTPKDIRNPVYKDNAKKNPYIVPVIPKKSDFSGDEQSYEHAITTYESDLTRYNEQIVQIPIANDLDFTQAKLDAEAIIDKSPQPDSIVSTSGPDPSTPGASQSATNANTPKYKVGDQVSYRQPDKYSKKSTFTVIYVDDINLTYTIQDPNKPLVEYKYVLQKDLLQDAHKSKENEGYIKRLTSIVGNGLITVGQKFGLVGKPPEVNATPSNANSGAASNTENPIQAASNTSTVTPPANPIQAASNPANQPPANPSAISKQTNSSAAATLTFTVGQKVQYNNIKKKIDKPVTIENYNTSLKVYTVIDDLENNIGMVDPKFLTPIP
jgi:hypothetical protein